MNIRGVAVPAPHDSLRRCEPTANQVNVLAGIQNRRQLATPAFDKANEIILGHMLTTAFDASVCIGWWIASKKSDKVKLEKEAFAK